MIDLMEMLNMSPEAYAAHQAAEKAAYERVIDLIQSPTLRNLRVQDIHRKPGTGVVRDCIAVNVPEEWLDLPVRGLSLKELNEMDQSLPFMILQSISDMMSGLGLPRVGLAMVGDMPCAFFACDGGKCRNHLLVVSSHDVYGSLKRAAEPTVLLEHEEHPEEALEDIEDEMQALEERGERIMSFLDDMAIEAMEGDPVQPVADPVPVPVPVAGVDPLDPATPVLSEDDIRKLLKSRPS